jgi:integrase/recombinase XerD
MNFENYTISFGQHYDKDVIFFNFPKNQLLQSELRAYIHVKYSGSKKVWYCLDMPQYRSRLQLPLKSFGDSILLTIHPINIDAYKLMQRELIIMGYSPNTQRVYLTEFAHFLRLLNHTDANTMTVDRLKSYMLYCSRDLGLRDNTLHSRLNAIKFYYDKILKREAFKYELPRPKKQSILPKVLSKEDIKKMFDSIENKKHRIALQLVYGMGLRVSEIVALKISDIDSKRMMVHIRHAKGKKDRYVPLPHSILIDLRTYFSEYRPHEYLLEGQAGGQYTIRSVQQIFKTALKKNNINKAVGIHGLRHSYATHLMEAGTDTTFIQKLLGHRDVKTTMIYTKVSNKHISNIVSPLDML